MLEQGKYIPLVLDGGENYGRLASGVFLQYEQKLQEALLPIVDIRSGRWGALLEDGRSAISMRGCDFRSWTPVFVAPKEGVPAVSFDTEPFFRARQGLNWTYFLPFELKCPDVDSYHADIVLGELKDFSVRDAIGAILDDRGYLWMLGHDRLFLLKVQEDTCGTEPMVFQLPADADPKRIVWGAEGLMIIGKSKLWIARESMTGAQVRKVTITQLIDFGQSRRILSTQADLRRQLAVLEEASSVICLEYSEGTSKEVMRRNGYNNLKSALWIDGDFFWIDHLGKGHLARHEKFALDQPMEQRNPLRLCSGGPGAGVLTRGRQVYLLGKDFMPSCFFEFPGLKHVGVTKNLLTLLAEDGRIKIILLNPNNFGLPSQCLNSIPDVGV